MTQFMVMVIVVAFVYALTYLIITVNAVLFGYTLIGLIGVVLAVVLFVLVAEAED